MLAFIARRMVLALFSIWVMSILCFAVIQLPPGDAVDNYLEDMMETQGANAMSQELAMERLKNLRSYFGLDRPMWYRYTIWVWNMRNLDFGYSFLRRGTSSAQMVKVTELIQDRLLFTIILSAVTSIFSFFVAFPIGIYAALRHNTIGDYSVTLVGFIGMSIPDFLFGLVVMYFFFAYFDVAVGGLFSGEYEYAPWSFAKVWDLLVHLIVPVVVIGTSGTAGGIRILRNNMLDELAKPYVVTARAKGLPTWKVIIKYPLRIAMNPMISGIGGMLPGLISGSTIIAIVLSLPTLGPLLLEAIMMEDVFLAGFVILMLGILTIVGVLISDIMLVVVDPRIKMWDQSVK